MARRESTVAAGLLIGAVLTWAPRAVSSANAAAPCPTGGEVFYVDPVNGSDGNCGTDPSQAFRTAVPAIARLGPGDTLRLRAAGFHSPVDFPATLQGTAGSPIRVEPYVAEGDTGTAAVFDGGIAALRTAPNDGWEPVPGGHPDEWRTKVSYKGHPDLKFRFLGLLLSAGHRLITYQNIEDFRAANESFRPVSLADAREGTGPVEGDETHKYPWTYFGPGAHWVRDHPASSDARGRIHVRLSGTHLHAPGITDYTGPSDPNQVALSLAPSTGVLKIKAQHMIFRNITFQNGGESTLTIEGQDLAFDHCQVYGAQYGVRLAASAARVTFRHSTFDGALAPWTTRSEVKTEVTYYDPYFHPGASGNVKRIYAPGKGTSDTLVSSDGTDLEFDHCTFRRGHDALFVKGRNVSIHHSLFEDINDEVMLFDKTARTGNVHVHENLIRQALSPLSFAIQDCPAGQTCQPVAGPFYIFRNVIDQRIPTRGERVLPPDAPAPHIWHYGNDFKMNATIPPFYAYQNTFISSHPIDKGRTLGLAFSDAPAAPAPPRSFLNNVHIGLNVDQPLSFALPNDATRTSQGNIWHQFHGGAPRFCPPKGSCTLDMAALSVLDPDWERDSQFLDPALANVDDEYFDHQVTYPNNDFRPSLGSPAVGAGVVLPADLPDPLRPADGSRPDVGALPAEGPPLAVGVDRATVLPVPGIPRAHAGTDQRLVDIGGDGFESVVIDGTMSGDEDGTVAAHEWREDRALRSVQASDTLYLPEGDHYLQLKVTDNTGITDTDGVRIQIRPLTPHGDNLLACPGFEEGACGWEIVGASLTDHPHSGNVALRMDASQQPAVRQRVAVSPGVTYRISAWAAMNAAPFAPAKARVVFVDDRELVVQATDLDFDTSSIYRYSEHLVVAPASAVAMEIFLGAQLQTGSVFFDDVRILDHTLLVNGGFEARAPNGAPDEAPGWRIITRFAEIVDDPAEARSGRRAVALVGTGSNRYIQQDVPLTGAHRYRVSGWVKTTGITHAPQIQIAFGNAAQVVLQATSEGRYVHVSQEFAVPAGARSLTLTLHLQAHASGTAYFDDLLIEPVGF